MSPKLILALDYENQPMAMSLVEQLDPTLCALKVGSEMYTKLGPNFIKRLIERQFKVFLDLKYHDIPNTVARACRAAQDLGVWMMSLHAFGGLKMMKAAREAIESQGGGNRPLLVAVTLLTSMESKELLSLGIDHSLETQVGLLAQLAKKSGLDGVVSAALEVPTIKLMCGEDFLTVSPGIRLQTDPLFDQARVTTPEAAMELGTNYIVVGRPITHAKEPLQAIQAFLLRMKR